MKTDTANKIIKYIQSRKQATAKEMVDYLEISRQALFKHLAKLLEQERIAKIGKPPKVFYYIKKIQLKNSERYSATETAKKIIDKNFLVITPTGITKEGWDGFVYWCQKNNQPIQKTAGDYIKTWKKYNSLKKDGLIDGMQKIKNTFEKVCLDHLFYLDFYSIERFGKTKLGQMLLYAKQSQNKKLIKKLILNIKPKVDNISKKYKIDGIGFIPPTIKREVQFMKELEKNLQLKIKMLSIAKVKTDIAVPQKSLSKLNDRIENAKSTIIVEEKNIYNNILLIDDAVGSGATLNETAAQIRQKGICQGKIIGLAITGSFKGFDIISEV
jgi:hypoxanthine-guanine phosphoribosyltransferase